MNPIRKLLIALALVGVLAAPLGAAVALALDADAPEPTSPAPSAPAAPPSAPSEEPAETPAVAGTITIVAGGAVDGPGLALSEAIANAGTDPVLANGILFMDPDGSLYLGDSLTDASRPTFGALRLRVVDYPFSAAEWDLANADLTGLQEVDGILFFEERQLFGVIDA